jgi:signal transduction histidine kinase
MLPRAFVQTAMHEAHSENRKYFIFPHRLASGEERTVEVHSTPIEIEGRHVLFSIIHDISLRRIAEQEIERLNQNLEKMVAERTQDLQTAHRDLESFTYSVSHDLRAPLRAISGFAELFLVKYGELVDEKGQRYLEQIVMASDRMARLIADLLEYSRLGKKAIVWEKVDLALLLDELIAENAGEIAEKAIAIEKQDSFPAINTDRFLLRQIMANLLGNAIKYGQAPERIIRISWEILPGFIAISIFDNGPGIPQEHHEQVFQVFQRLVSEKEAPGTGIGLSVVKKAVELLNGKIELDSRPGVGSTFRVILPAA